MSGKKRRGYIKRIAEAVDMPMSEITGGFRVELFENSEMLIENHQGILEYRGECVRINCGRLIMTVEGEGLVLVAMNGGGISLKGQIISITYCN